MIDLNLLRTFAKVSELGSFTKAANYLKQPKSRVSRAITRLETDLGTQLIRRTTRTTALTEAGQELFQKTNKLLSQLYTEVDSIAHEAQELTGTLKLSAPEDFSQQILPTLISEFSDLHPKISFDVLASNNEVNLTTNEIDVAFKIGPLKDSSLMFRKIGTVSLILVAAPSYYSKYGVPKSIEDLKNHRILSFINQNNGDILKPLYQKFSTSDQFKPFLTCNSFFMIHKLTCEGRGLSILPDFFCKQSLIDGKLIRTLTEWRASEVDIQLVYPPVKKQSKKVRSFIDFAIEKTSYLNLNS